MWLASLLLLLAAVASAGLLPTDPSLPIESRAHAYIRAASEREAAAIAAEIGGALVRASDVPNHFLAEMHPDRPYHPAVTYVTHDFEPFARTLGVRPMIPVPFAMRDAVAPDWTLHVLNARAAWNASTGADAVVVLPDCGVDWTHPDLARVDGASAINIVQTGSTAMPTLSEAHGTMAASQVVAADNGLCGTGVAPAATVVPERLLVPGIPLSSTHIAEAMVYVPARHNAASIRAVTNSFGPNDYNPHIAQLDSVVISAFTALYSRNTTLIFAAGNGYQYGDHMSNDGFASSRYTVAVGALGHDGRAAPYTEAGAVAVCAPSSNDYVGVTGATPGDTCSDEFGGTSAAAPQIAGVVALLRPAAGADPLTPADVLDVLVHAAQSNLRVVASLEPMLRNGVGMYYSSRIGFGAPDAAVAVALAANRTARWVPRTVSVPLNAARPTVEYGTGAFEVPMAGNGTVLWGAVVLGLELGQCTLAHVNTISLESPAGTVAPVYVRSYLYGTRSLTEHELPTRAFHGESAAGTWKVHINHACQPSVLLTDLARVELQVV